MTRRRVAITGADVLSPLGTTWYESAHALCEGRGGVRAARRLGSSDLPTRLAGEAAWSFDAGPNTTRIQAMIDRTSARAIEDSGLRTEATRVGVVVGIGRQPASIDDSEAENPCASVSREYENQAVRLGARWHCQGPAHTCYTACATGNDAVGLALRMLRRGEVDVVLCGAADSQIAAAPLLEFTLLNALAIPRFDREAHPRPFDRDRNGFVVGEGAAMFVLEDMDHARRRGAPIVAELAGYGSAGDGHSLTRGRPDRSGAVRAMKAALEDARISPDAVDYINAHATGTPLGDIAEAEAIHLALGAAARTIPVSSTKAMSGHLLAAAGAVELAYCLMALDGQFIPPTLNCDNQDPLCDVDCVANEARRATVNVVMSNAFGFGGQNSCLVVAHRDRLGSLHSGA